MPIRVLGFPFGDRLALGRAKPSVSIGTGTVSRARIDEYERFQIDADVKEGNSGGPVVDERGRLAGVAVARVAGTRIGLAVHAKWGDEVFQGPVNGSTIKLSEPAGAGPRRRVLLEYELLDPLQTMHAVSLFLVRRDRVRWPAPPPEDFRWSLLAPDMLEVPFRIEGRRALAEVVLDTPEAYVARHRFVRGSGQAVVSSPYELVERKRRRAGVILLPPPRWNVRKTGWICVGIGVAQAIGIGAYAWRPRTSPAPAQAPGASGARASPPPRVRLGSGSIVADCPVNVQVRVHDPPEDRFADPRARRVTEVEFELREWSLRVARDFESVEVRVPRWNVSVTLAERDKAYRVTRYFYGSFDAAAAIEIEVLGIRGGTELLIYGGTLGRGPSRRSR